MKNLLLGLIAITAISTTCKSTEIIYSTFNQPIVEWIYLSGSEILSEQFNTKNNNVLTSVEFKIQYQNPWSNPNIVYPGELTVGISKGRIGIGDIWEQKITNIRTGQSNWKFDIYEEVPLDSDLSLFMTSTTPLYWAATNNQMYAQITADNVPKIPEPSTVVMGLASAVVMYCFQRNKNLKRKIN